MAKRTPIIAPMIAPARTPSESHVKTVLFTCYHGNLFSTPIITAFHSSVRNLDLRFVI